MLAGGAPMSACYGTTAASWAPGRSGNTECTELHVNVDDLQRRQPRAETNGDEPACRGANYQVEVLDEGGVAVHLELGEDRCREQPPEPATIECEDLEPVRPCARYGSRIGVGFGELTDVRHLVSSG